jgi:hypothetical protein
MLSKRYTLTVHAWLLFRASSENNGDGREYIDMLDGWGIAIAASGWGAWIAKEIITRLLDRRLARTGGIGLVEGRSRIVCDTTDNSGNTFVVDYFSGMSRFPQYSDCREFRVIFDSQFFNDTDTQVVFTSFDLDFWGVEGLRLQVSGAHLLVPTEGADTWQSAGAITVPAHSVTPVRFAVPVGSNFPGADEYIRDYVGEAVVLLRTQSIDGKMRSFRLCTRSFAGSNAVSWQPQRKYPIFSIYALNVGGRNAGRRPQPRQPVANAIADV